MSQSRVEQKKSLTSKLKEFVISYKEVIRPVVQTVTTGVGVATVLYPIELIQTRLQLNATVSGAGWSSYFLANTRLIFNGFLHANRASLVKNSVISQKEAVHEPMNDLVNERDMHPTNKKITAAMGSSLVIGLLDTGFTNFFANMRVFNSIGVDPVFINLKQKIAFAATGFNPRFIRNGAGAFFCISSSTLLEEPLEAYLPAEKFGITSNVISTVSLGSISGVLTNGLDVVYKRKVSNTCLETLKSPRAFDVAKEIYVKEGMRAFMRGSWLSAVCSVMAFGTINGIDALMNSYFYALDQSVRNQQLRDQQKLFAATVKKEAAPAAALQSGFAKTQQKPNNR